MPVWSSAAKQKFGRFWTGRTGQNPPATLVPVGPLPPGADLTRESSPIFPRPRSRAGLAQNSEPFGKENLWIKKHAILELLLEVVRKSSLPEAKAGLQVPITPEQLRQKIEQLRSRKQ
jgi:hypothetical protein